MKIVQLLPSLEIGGMERLAVDLAVRQKAEGHQASIFCTSHPGALAPQAEKAGVRIRSFGKRDGFSPRLVLRLAEALREERADILHAHNALVLHYGIIATRLAKIPAVINTRHGGNLFWDPRRERIWSRMARYADAVVFVSQGVREFFVDRTGISQRNTAVIYNGIDVEGFSSRRASPGARRPRFVFGAVGRMQPAKDHVSLVRAFGSVAARLLQAELHILGDGPCRSEVAGAAASLGIADRVVLHGAGLDVAGFLSALDVFVLSSIDEGLPISLMEAMAAGLPVISTLLPGLPELAPDHIVAGYCPPGQPEALSALMLRTALRRDLPAIGTATLEWAKKFGITECWRQYRELFERTLERKRPGARLRAAAN